jgi:hypothetical protein
MAAQTLPRAAIDQIIERTEGCGTQASDRGGCTRTASEGSGHGARGIGRALEKGYRPTRVIVTRPSPSAPWRADPQESSGQSRAGGTDGKGA